jgi:hypothetical protein
MHGKCLLRLNQSIGSARVEKSQLRLNLYNPQNVHGYICARPCENLISSRITWYFYSGLSYEIHRITKSFLLFQVCLGYISIKPTYPKMSFHVIITIMINTVRIELDSIYLAFEEEL